MTSHPAPTGPPGPVPSTRELPRPPLWGLLILAVTADGLSSFWSLPVPVGVATGILALALGALLIRDHYRRRAQPHPPTP